MIDVPARVKDALRDGRMLKNYRFNVLNDDGTVDFTIENDNLVSESVKIDERMCTGNQLKFGLCEGSSLEFQYFDNPNITGRQIQAFIDVQYVDADNELQWYEIPMGFFTVDQCPMQFSTGIRKVTAYNKLRSAYLDAKANNMLLEDFNNDPTVVLTTYDVQKNLLENYAVIEAPRESIDISGSPIAGSGYTIQHIYFNQIADLDTPISAYEACHELPLSNLPSEVHLNSDSVGREITVPANSYWQLSTKRGDIEVLLSNIVDYITGIILEANLQRYSTDITEDMARSLAEDLSEISIYYQIGSGNWTSVALHSYDANSKIAQINGKIISRESATFRISMPVKFRVLGTSYDAAYVKLNEAYTYSYYISGATPGVYTQIETKTRTPNILDGIGENYTGILQDYFSVDLLQLSDAEKILYTIGSMPDFTLREIMSATYETVCQFGKLDRETDLFSGIDLNNTRLLPADTLYPSDTLYPMGNSVRANKSMYQKLWTDSQGVQSFRYLIITYKGLDEEQKEVEKTLQRTVNADGTTDYNMSDNWLFKNLVWSDADVGTYADAMVLKMQNVTWFPFEMWCAGLPYIETGDELEISNSEGTYTSYVLQRQLNGIQNLQDTFIDGELDIF